MKHFLIPLFVLMTNLGWSQACIDSTLIDLESVCTQEYDPVCGCDGVTYYNSCAAEKFGGVTSWEPGICPGSNLCMDLEDIDFGLCDMWLGYAVINGNCESVSGCSYIVDEVNYEPYFFEEEADCQLSCEVSNDICLNIDGVDFGPCDMWLGYALLDGTCQSISGCNYIVDEINYEPYFFPDETSCASACETLGGNCMDLNNVDFGLCDMWLGYGVIDGNCQSISGCSYVVDNFNYQPYFFENENDCILSCEALSDTCVDVLGVDFGDCDAWLGYAKVNGICQGISGCSYIVDGINYEPYFFPDEVACFEACEMLGGNCLDLENLDFGMCEMWLGYAVVNGTCQSLNGCGYVIGDINYQPYFFLEEQSCMMSCSMLSVPEENTNQLSLYPNPATHTVHLSLKNAINGAQLTVRNTMGQQVYTTTLSPMREMELPVHFLDNGMYIIEIITNNHQTYREMFLKLR